MVGEVAVTIFLFLSLVESLNNGLARTPPMGWLSWERFRCNVDCVNYPNDCINANLFEKMTDLMASDGYADAGYNYVIMDDCWLAKTRDAKQRLQPDPQRFPKGIKALADYVHMKGLKLGIYEDVGHMTCAKYPGSAYHFQLDAQTFADWGVDYLKFDGCYYHPSEYTYGYPPMAFYLNMTGRSIVLSCEYALYQKSYSNPNYTGIAEACNVARNFDDIDDSWDSLRNIIEYYGNNTGNFADVAGPGYFNDPDMLVIGNFGLSPDQERVQMAIWCILAAPLIMSNDLRNIREESKKLLLNKLAISVNQDILGIQGKRIHQTGGIQIWTKPIMPKGSYAFVLLNTNTATPQKVTVTISEATFKGWKNSNLMAPIPKGFNLTEVFDNKYLGFFKPNDQLTTFVNPTGVFFGIAKAVY